MTIMTRKEEWAQAFGDIGIAPRMQLMQLPLHILDPWQGADGQHQPFIHHILTDGTPDERVMQSLERKDSVQESLLRALRDYLNGVTR